MRRGVIKHTEETKRRISKSLAGDKCFWFGKKIPEEMKKKISISKKGSIPWNKGKKNIYSKETIEKMRIHRIGKKSSMETRMKQKLSMLGSKNHKWRGGLTEVNDSIRNSLEYRIWRESVLKRDNFTCVFCNKRGGDLEADHIKRFSEYPELRFVLENGRTLCVPCHRKTPTYGSRKIYNVL